MTKRNFPFDGQMHPAKERKFRELVFFVPFFGSRKLQLKRHVAFVNELGFDAFTFHLPDGPSLWMPPISVDGRIGLKHVFADRIEELLNEIEGPKIIYSFSNPTAAAIEAMARRHCSDTIALIADSGPTAHFMKSVYKLYDREKKFGFLPLRLAAVPVFSMAWSPHLHADIHEQLESFPSSFPVLSIRGWKDPLIPPSHIDDVFDPHPRLDWRKLALPEGGHLNGLRDFPADYKPPVERFLKGTASFLVSQGNI